MTAHEAHEREFRRAVEPYLRRRDEAIQAWNGATLAEKIEMARAQMANMSCGDVAVLRERASGEIVLASAMGPVPSGWEFVTIIGSDAAGR